MPTYTPEQIKSINAARSANVDAGRSAYSGDGATSYSIARQQGGAGDALARNVPTTADLAQRTAQDNFLRLNQSQADQTINADNEYSTALNRYQGQIDSTNNVYNDLLNKARLEGQGRLGTDRAQQARGGLLGGDFGTAQTARQTAENVGVETGIENERQSILQQIYSGARVDAQRNVEAKKLAKRQGVEAVLEYQTNVAPGLRKATVNKVAQALFTNKIDPSTMSPSERRKLADVWGVTEDDITNAYGVLKSDETTKLKTASDLAAKTALESRKSEAEILKINADIAKGKLIEISEGALLYNTETGKTTKNPKTFAPKSTGFGSTMSTGQVTAFNQIVSKQNASPLIQAADRTIVLQNSIKEVRAKPSDGPTQLNLVYSYVQALDTYQSAVREGELGLVNSIDSKIGQYQGYVQKIQNGQIVRPEVAKQIADAAEGIVTTIKQGAEQKSKSFASQAKVIGLGSQWQQYTQGFQPGYAQESLGGAFQGDGLSEEEAYQAYLNAQ